jgi:hypothetical protein
VLQEPPLPPVERLTQIGDAEAVADMLRDTNYSGALVKLKRDDDAYLFVAPLHRSLRAGHRQQQHGERDHSIHQRRGKLHADAPRFEIGVALDAVLGPPDLLRPATPCRTHGTSEAPSGNHQCRRVSGSIHPPPDEEKIRRRSSLIHDSICRAYAATRLHARISDGRVAGRARA